MSITGLHHVTAITADAQRNIDFYTGPLGLRLVKVTVNFDDPGSYHLYYGDELGRPGSAITFFAWPGAARGRVGPPQVTATAFSVPRDSVPFWRERLTSAGIPIGDTGERFSEEVLAFSDPDGMPIEVIGAVRDERTPWRAGPVSAEYAIRGFHSVTLSGPAVDRTAALLTESMGFRQGAAEGDRLRFAPGEGERAVPGGFVDVVPTGGAARGTLGAGIVHHVAFGVPDDPSHVAWHTRLVEARRNVSPVIDRTYFHSIYFREPGGVLFEFATDGPGFTVDETPDQLGSALRLPPQYEPFRARIESTLPPITLPSGRKEGRGG